MLFCVGLGVPDPLNKQAVLGPLPGSLGWRGAGIITTALITLLGQARIFVVLGRGRLLPEWLAQVHAARLTPQHATILSSAAAGVPRCAPACAVGRRCLQGLLPAQLEATCRTMLPPAEPLGVPHPGCACRHPVLARCLPVLAACPRLLPEQATTS